MADRATLDSVAAYAKVSRQTVSNALNGNVQFDLAGRYVDALTFLNVPYYFEMDARIAWQITNNMEVSFVGQNLLNKAYFAMLVNGPIAYRPDTGARIGSTDYFGRYAPPRTFGIRAGVSF